MYYWIRALVAEASPDTIRLFPFLESIPDLNHAAATRSGADRLRLLLVHLLNIRGNPAGALWPWQTPLFHASQHIANPPRRQRYLTSTIYDLTCWLFPETHQSANVAATKRYADGILRKSDACIAISESARQDAIDILRIPAARIVTIYPGVPDEFFDPPLPDPVKRTHGLEKPYFLYVGAIEPRKGIDTMLDAYARLPVAIRSHCDLVLAGMYGWMSEKVRSRLANPECGVRYLGYVNETELPALTAGALTAVFPSTYEGFGFPVAQAMAAGVPVITSRGSSLEEIAAGAAVLVTPGDTEELGAAMMRIAESEELCRSLSAAGRERARLFRWASSARKSMMFFDSVVGARNAEL